MAVTTYVVKNGDTLSDIAARYPNDIAGSTIYARVQTLVDLNNIRDPNYIVVGQVLRFSSSGSSSTTTTTNNTSRANVNVFGLQSNTTRTMYACWVWSKSNTENYQAVWYYDTGDGVWFIGSDSSVDDPQSIYSAPENALRVKFKVKPISKTRTVNEQETSYWTAGWSSEKTYNFSNNPPSKPEAPKVSINKYTLVAELSKVDLNATHIQFQVVRDNASVYKTGTATINTNHAAFSCVVDASGKYKVRCRSYRSGMYSEWSDYSENDSTVPSIPSGITVCRAASSTSVYLEWSGVNSATKYDIQHTQKKEYFDGTGDVTPVSDLEVTKCTIDNLETGKEYFFRVRAKNDKGASDWSGIKSVVIGKVPSAPTTWSNVESVIVGNALTLYWIHNSEDGSDWTYSRLEVYVDGAKLLIPDISNLDTDGEDDGYASGSYPINTSQLTEGATIEWRVATAGVTNQYGEFSVQRTIKVYAPPTLELRASNADDEAIETLTSFPLYIYALAGPSTQIPTGYYITVTANDSYETSDMMGNSKTVSRGDQVYGNHFDVSSDSLLVELSAGQIDLENNVEYTIKCIVSMDSGLTAEETYIFSVSWTDEEYEPNAEISIDHDTFTASICPYCIDEYGVPIDNITLSVYRREFDGKFVELATGIANTRSSFITDPHPALDFARYRVVATNIQTGAMSYCDISGYPVGGTAVIIQWNEDWSYFETSGEDELEQPPWSGSMLKLPYNIDVSDGATADVSLVEYIGREHPVSYYGTQRGVTSTWSVAIPKNDIDTLYALRRLQAWMGDVYVREPSGSGYWANISVSFNQKHRDLIIPVTLDIKRVEGGV